jgi:cell wall-associated NlpC family hydrolase
VADPNNPNLYSYARNNPLRFIDSTGLEATLGDMGIANPGGINYSPTIPVGGSTSGSGNPGTGGPTGGPSSPQGGNNNKSNENNGNDNSNNNFNTEVKSEREQQLEMAKEILADKIGQLADQLEQADPNSEQYKAILKELQRTYGLYRSVLEILDGDKTRQQVVDVARKFVKQRIPYGHSQRPFDEDNKDKMMDCSELTYRVFKELGITIPQLAESQYQYFKEEGNIITDPHGAKIGDIVFFTEPDAGKVTHVAIVSEVNEKGEIKYVHAPEPGRLVEEKSDWKNMSGPYYSTRFVAFGRI